MWDLGKGREGREGSGDEMEKRKKGKAKTEEQKEKGWLCIHLEVTRVRQRETTSA